MRGVAAAHRAFIQLGHQGLLELGQRHAVVDGHLNMRQVVAAPVVGETGVCVAAFELVPVLGEVDRHGLAFVVFTRTHEHAGRALATFGNAGLEVVTRHLADGFEGVGGFNVDIPGDTVGLQGGVGHGGGLLGEGGGWTVEV